MGNLTTVHSISRSGNATMLTAANNGDYSFAFRGQRAAANQPMWGIHNSVNSRLTNIFFDASTIRLQRDNGGGSTYWLVGGQSFTVGTLYTVGVSVDRVNGTTTTSYFYLNGALVGSQSQTTLDIDFTGSSELIGSIIAGISPRGAYVGGGNWSTLLTGPDHLVIHNYLSATYP
jgi:hypothetical protein